MADRITALLQSRVPSLGQTGSAALQAATGRTTFGEALNAQRATELAKGQQLLDVFKTKQDIKLQERGLSLKENELLYRRVRDRAEAAARKGEREAEWVKSIFDWHKDVPLERRGEFASRVSKALTEQEPTSFAGAHGVAGKIAAEMGLRESPKIKSREVKIGDQIHTEFYDEDTGEVLRTEVAPRYKPGVTIVNAAEKAETVGHAKLRVDDYERARDAAFAAQDMVVSLDRMEQLLDAGLETGATRPAVTAAAAFLSDAASLFGIPLPEMEGIDPNKSDEWVSYVNRMTAELTKMLRGPLSDKELRFLQGVTPQLGSTPEANRRIIEALRKAAMRSQRYFDMLNEYKLNHGGSTEGFDRVWLRYRQDNPLDFSGRVEEEIDEPITSEPSAPVEVTTPQEAESLAPGTRYITPDGQVYIR